ncbi:unnamed protein product [Lactuca saligna]|uniref:Uncharacterized protein n=1 Tax=Lactuca saligna TaxID=75948 RepID=A0AA35YDU7_LACSI|nr:unnamed protein product [Lactuca saligna]
MNGNTLCITLVGIKVATPYLGSRGLLAAKNRLEIVSGFPSGVGNNLVLGTKIAVALWDSFALKLNTYISKHHNETALVIILLRLAKLKIWGG